MAFIFKLTESLYMQTFVLFRLYKITCSSGKAGALNEGGGGGVVGKWVWPFSGVSGWGGGGSVLTNNT